MTWINSDGYVMCQYGKDEVQEHRLVWYSYYGVWPTTWIDHIDGNRSNNAISNLREVTKAQNAWNSGQYSNNKSGHKGVIWNKAKNKWQVYITANKKTKHLGMYTSFEEAVEVRQLWEELLFGEYRRPLR